MSLEIKNFEVDMTYHKIIDGVVEEIVIENNIYRRVRPESGTAVENDSYQLVRPEIRRGLEEKGYRRPVGALELSKIYHVWVTKKSILKVKQAIQHVELNYVPTAEAIHKQSGISISKCRATLQYLLHKNKIHKIRFEKDGRHVFTYFIKEEQQKKERGKRLGSMKGNPMYENVLNEVVAGIKDGKKYPELEKIIEQYYPGCTKSTYHSYVNLYKRWYRESSSLESLEPKGGKVIAQLGGNTIREKIFIDISKGIDEGLDEKELLGIIKSYHPNVKPSSLYTYLKIYQRYKKESSRNQD